MDLTFFMFKPCTVLDTGLAIDGIDNLSQFITGPDIIHYFADFKPIPLDEEDEDYFNIYTFYDVILPLSVFSVYYYYKQYIDKFPECYI